MPIIKRRYSYIRRSTRSTSREERKQAILNPRRYAMNRPSRTKTRRAHTPSLETGAQDIKHTITGIPKDLEKELGAKAARHARKTPRGFAHAYCGWLFFTCALSPAQQTLCRAVQEGPAACRRPRCPPLLPHLARPPCAASQRASQRRHLLPPRRRHRRRAP